MKFDNILVIGGSGFVGRHLVAALAARGTSVTVPSRRRDRARHLLTLPTVEVVEADVTRRDALRELVAGRDAVVNLIGVLHSRRGPPGGYGPDFAAAHADFPRTLAEVCRETGVRRLLHMSALGAAPDAPSEYLRSKAAGEQAVLGGEGLVATVFRPSVIFGPDDAFLNMFACLARYLPVLALACPEARFQPVFVGDVARAFIAALDAPDARGACYELCGPTVYSLRALLEYVCRTTGRRRLIIGLPDSLSYLQAWMMEFAPVKLLTRDNIRSMQVPSVRSEGGAPLPFELAPTALEAVAPGYLARATPRARYPAMRFRARR